MNFLNGRNIHLKKKIKFLFRVLVQGGKQTKFLAQTASPSFDVNRYFPDFNPLNKVFKTKFKKRLDYSVINFFPTILDIRQDCL